MFVNSIYLSKWTGTGTPDDPFRPFVTLLFPDLHYKLFDLRPIELQDTTEGYCLVSFDFDLLHDSLVPLFDCELYDSYDVVDPHFAQCISDLLGVQCAGETFREVLADLLLHHYGLQPASHEPGYVLHLMHHMIFLTEAPPMSVSGGATDLENNLPIVEDFVRANGTTIGNRQSWTEVTGDLATSSNKIIPNVTTVNYAAQARCEATTLSTNHFAYAEWTTGAGSSLNDYGQVEVSVRWNGSNSERYAFAAEETGTSTARNTTYLYKINSSNTYTIITSVGGTPSGNGAAFDLSGVSGSKKGLQLSADGSTLVGWYIVDNYAVAAFEATDSTYTGSVRGGIGIKVGATAANYRGINSFYMDDVKGALGSKLSTSSATSIVATTSDATSFGGTLSSCDYTKANLVVVMSRIASGTPNTPTLSGAGVTWTQGVTHNTGVYRVTVFYGTNTRAFSSGTITADFASQTQTYCTIQHISLGNPVDSDNPILDSDTGTAGQGVYFASATCPTNFSTTYATDWFNPVLFALVGQYDSATSFSATSPMTELVDVGGTDMEAWVGVSSSLTPSPYVSTGSTNTITYATVGVLLRTNTANSLTRGVRT